MKRKRRKTGERWGEHDGVGMGHHRVMMLVLLVVCSTMFACHGSSQGPLPLPQQTASELHGLYVTDHHLSLRRFQGEKGIAAGDVTDPKVPQAYYAFVVCKSQEGGKKEAIVEGEVREPDEASCRHAFRDQDRQPTRFVVIPRSVADLDEEHQEILGTLQVQWQEMQDQEQRKYAVDRWRLRGFFGVTFPAWIVFFHYKDRMAAFQGLLSSLRKRGSGRLRTRIGVMLLLLSGAGAWFGSFLSVKGYRHRLRMRSQNIKDQAQASGLPARMVAAIQEADVGSNLIMDQVIFDRLLSSDVVDISSQAAQTEVEIADVLRNLAYHLRHTQAVRFSELQYVCLPGVMVCEAL